MLMHSGERLRGLLPTRRGNDRDPRMLTQPTTVKASVGGRLATLLSRRRVVEVLSVHLRADHPNLISDEGILRWKEWGYGDPDPQSWIKVTAAEAGRDRLPITLVAIDSAGRALGAVALGAADPELNDGERGDRSPWLLGLVVRQQDRRRGIGGLLVSKLERLAADLGYRQVWVATGGEAVEFYRQCGWRDAQELRLVGTRIQTTILNKRVGTTLT